MPLTFNEPLLDVNETAEKLGCHPFHVYRLAGSGALRSVRHGGARLFPQSAVEDYLPLRRRRKSRAVSALG
jgi:excisionase family DNA binding protein